MTPNHGIVTEVQHYLEQYVTFPSSDYAFAAALWAVGTFFWQKLDVFPYMVITSDTKRSGKTRTAELLSFVVNNPRSMSGMTPATIYRIIGSQHPTMFVDEAETLASEAASLMRIVLNVGYRRGQTIPRTRQEEVIDYEAYCPKCFILIGDVYDTLRDRCLTIRLQRGASPSRFLFDIAKAEGQALRSKLELLSTEKIDQVVSAYHAHARLDYLGDRDEEIWLPLMAICFVLEPGRLADLPRVSVDLSMDKMAPARLMVDLKGAEEKADEIEYAERLLRDMVTIIGKEKGIFTRDALPKLYELPTAPWRKFRGEGLTALDIGLLLGRFKGLSRRSIRVGTKYRGKGQPVGKGYLKADLEKALRSL